MQQTNFGLILCFRSRRCCFAAFCREIILVSSFTLAWLFSRFFKLSSCFLLALSQFLMHFCPLLISSTSSFFLLPKKKKKIKSKSRPLIMEWHLHHIYQTLCLRVPRNQLVVPPNCVFGWWLLRLKNRF